MNLETTDARLNVFPLESELPTVAFVRRDVITTGVVCDSYSFVSDSKRDLGIIKIEPGCKTPLQKVLLGERTIEGYVLGKGRLKITPQGAQQPEVYDVGEENGRQSFSVDMQIGDLMQWEAADH